jgi:predicted O-linked N-acetylglucosamine transferase (SPINDLY family)
LRIRPDHAKTLNALGHVLAEQGQRSEAVLHCQRAVQLNPSYAEAWNTMGVALREQGQLDEAAEAFGRAHALKPADPAIHSNVLQCAQYRLGVTPALLASLHAEWDELHAEPHRPGWPAHPNARDPDRPLRVGFVSPDLGNNPVGILTIRALEALNRESMRLYFYSGRRNDDDRTRRFRKLGQWREVRHLSDAALAEQIRGDRIDVLFDLSGHVGGNRLLVFARKPAPVQITWAGYVGTTGLRAMDYLVADPQEAPRGDDAYYRERILRLPSCYAGYDPPAGCPDVGPPPAARTGAVTFGGAHNPSKLNPAVVGAWAEILRRVPGSRLLLRYRGLDDPPVQRRYRELFAAHGTDESRVELAGWCPPPELMAWYGRVDVALDPFPYSGGVTTCDSLWMGVPVVTLVGSTFAGRHAYTYLHNVGLANLASEDVANYIEAAVALAYDHDRLANLRSQLRDRMATTVCNGARLAGELQAAIRGAWRDWCTSRG